MEMPTDLGQPTIDIILTIQHMIQDVNNNEGRIPVAHLDHVYGMVMEHIIKNSKSKRDSKIGLKEGKSESGLLKDTYMRRPRTYSRPTPENWRDMSEKT
jgi:hypothetical protein